MMPDEAPIGSGFLSRFVIVTIPCLESGYGIPRNPVITMTAKRVHNHCVRHLVELGRPARTGDARLRIDYAAQNGQTPSYAMQLVTNYYLPWQTQPSTSKQLELSLTYPPQPCRVGQTIDGKATITYRGTEPTGMLILSWGLPPGTEPVREKLDALVGASCVSRYEIAGNEVVFYLTPMEKTGERLVICPLRATTAVVGQTPASRVYDYYAPTLGDTASPVSWIVEQP